MWCPCPCPSAVFQELKLILAPVMPVRVALYVVFALDLVILEKSFVRSSDQAASKRITWPFHVKMDRTTEGEGSLLNESKLNK